MKKAMFGLVVVIGCCFASCNKCVTCHTDDGDTKYCKGDPWYETAKRGNMTDIHGATVQCD